MHLPAEHFLGFDIDPQLGFMTPVRPLRRLPPQWELWEAALTDAIEQQLQVGDQVPSLTETSALLSEQWRASVRDLPVIATDELMSSIALPQLRRAHLVLSFILHFYVHTHPPDATAIRIPTSISIPLMRISGYLDIPPLLTYADTVLFNWHCGGEFPTVASIRSSMLFTNLPDEQEFYLASARIELRGAEALRLMHSVLVRLHSSDNTPDLLISDLLGMEKIISDIKDLLVQLRNSCDPEIYYHKVRPWLRGEDSVNGQKWIFEGAGSAEYPDTVPPSELSGPSAGQSSLIHALDVFLGISQDTEFLRRMRLYMPKQHRLFLDYLARVSPALRTRVLDAKDEGLSEAYNKVVLGLKTLRDSHMMIATSYVVGPARRLLPTGSAPLKGTGGTNLVKFLNDFRNRTMGTLIRC